MRRLVRNQLAELLLRAFEDPRNGDAILWLRLFCDLAGHGDRSEVPLAELLEEGSSALPGLADGGKAVLACMIGGAGLFRIRRADTGEELQAGIQAQPTDVPWLIGLRADLQPAMAGICERARAYANLLTSFHEMGLEPRGSDPLQRGVAQAAACFNAGLFFEAHEHLEQFWRCQPRGQTRRFLQGIIQISVGFHHAQRGSYDGAVNQLAKGLEKTTGVTGEVLGLDWDAFMVAVAKTRDAIVARGREAMHPLPLMEIPSMGVVGRDVPDAGPSNRMHS